ncbi:hypothetical protein V2J09_003347 [Rumex salicifolius]
MSTLIIPDVIPPPKEDAEKLRHAFEGWRVDGRAIITILGHRNASQRKQIREAYQQLYNQSLIDGLSKVSGDFGKAIKLWTYDSPERDARLAHQALTSTKKGGVKELQVIVEIACASSANHLLAVRQIYCSLFDCSLEEDIVSHVPLPMRKLLVGLVSSYRHDKKVVDPKLAELEAAKLHDLILTKQLDHDDLALILTTRNLFQLRATFGSYQLDFKTTILEDIASTGNGNAQALLKIVIMCMDCPEKHFAEVIRASIIGLGTDEDSLTRGVLTRAEVDMSRIKEVYLELNKEGVDQAIIGDTSGDYKDFLLTLIGIKL